MISIMIWTLSSIWSAVHTVAFNVTLCFVIASHARAMLSDPGVVPVTRVPQNGGDAQQPSSTTVVNTDEDGTRRPTIAARYAPSILIIKLQRRQFLLVLVGQRLVRTGRHGAPLRGASDATSTAPAVTGVHDRRPSAVVASLRRRGLDGVRPMRLVSATARASLPHLQTVRATHGSSLWVTISNALSCIAGPWVNNCVGEYNQRYFVQFCVYVGIASLYCLALVACAWVWPCAEPPCPSSLRSLPPAYHTRVLHSIFVSIESALFGLFVVAVSCDQFQAILGDETAVEQVQRGRSAQHRPEKSRRALLVEVFGAGPAICWLLPCRRDGKERNRDYVHLPMQRYEV